MKSCIDHAASTRSAPSAFQRNLIAAWTAYVAGRIDAKALKGVSAGFGIYQQRDGTTMMRVRRVGGEITTGDLRAAAAILRAQGGAWVHLTTRQDFQLHGIPAAAVTATLAACTAAGFAFRGGGGDTFRNTLVSAYSGLHEDSAFDVRPYARTLSAAFYSFDLAYALPRKLKIAFADRAADAALAQTNDLGFVAARVGGRRVFTTYLGGGLGFKPALGFKLFDALSAADSIRVAMALTALFNDKGCRTNRAHARIRFLRADLGDAAFAALLGEYLAKVPPTVQAAVPDGPTVLPAPTAFPIDAVPEAGFDVWRALAVTPLARDLAAVRIFVPFGNFTADELDAFVAAMEAKGVREFVGLPSLDLGLVVPANQLAGVYNALAALPRDYVARSFVGNIRTCVGCGVCKSGVTDAPAIGRAVAEHFDAVCRPLDTPAKRACAQALLNDVRISGCPNSCTGHQLARFGFAGRLVDGVAAEQLYTPGAMKPARLGEPIENALPLAATELPSYLEKVIYGV